MNSVVKFRLATLFTVLALTFMGTRTQAQSDSSQLMLQINGDLWTWSATSSGLVRRTQWAFNQVPIISPDGTMAAYKSTASLAVDVIKKSGPVGGGDLPANLWVLSMSTSDALRIADQPADASFMQSGQPDKFIVRSVPAWSPDSKFIAYTQLIENGQDPASPTGQLVIYDLQNKTEQVIVSSFPAQYGVPGALPLAWGSSGIAVWSITATSTASGQIQVDDTLLVYNIKGQLLSSIKIDDLYEFAWVKDADKEYLGVLAKSPSSNQTQGTQWLLVEATTGRIFAMPGLPELYSLSAPGGASIFPASIGTAPDWEMAAADGTLVKLGNIDDVYAFTHALAISPDGQQVAYIQQGSAFVFGRGHTTKIVPSDVNSLGWGPTGWRVRRKFN